MIRALQVRRDVAGHNKTRTLKLASLSRDEIVLRVEVLMRVAGSSSEMRQAINSAVAWLNEVTSTARAAQETQNPIWPAGRPQIRIAPPGSAIGARSCDSEANKPSCVGCNSEKKNTLAETQIEQRTSYRYLGIGPKKLLTREHPTWQ